MEVVFASGTGTTYAVINIMNGMVFGFWKVTQVIVLAAISAYVGHRVKKFLDSNTDFTLWKGFIVLIKFIKHKLYGIFKRNQ